MSPFLPPHHQYDFGPVYYSPPIQYNDEVEDAAYCSSLFVHSPMPQYQQLYQHVDPSQLQEQPMHSAEVANTSCQPIQEEQEQENAEQQPLRSRRSLSLRKRGPAPPAIDAKKHHHQQVKSPVNTITPDRFSACIPCRRRKIKCIPKGDSHHYLSNGTNNGTCATCIRRKKDCFWPKIVVAATSASPDITESKTIDQASPKVEEETEKEQSKENEVSLLAQVKKEELEVALEETSLPLVVENYFGIPTPGFGRSVSTPALTLSSSSSSASSSLPVSPRTDASFLSPTCSESYFFEHEEKPASNFHSSSHFLDTLQQSFQSSQHQTLFADETAAF